MKPNNKETLYSQNFNSICNDSREKLNRYLLLQAMDDRFESLAKASFIDKIRTDKPINNL